MKTKNLVELIQEWEVRSGFTARTLAFAKDRGVRPSTAYRIAKALGCTDQEAKEYADKASQKPSERKAS